MTYRNKLGQILDWVKNAKASGLQYPDLTEYSQ